MNGYRRLVIHTCRAFTLVELLIALAIMAIALGIAVPALQPNDRIRLLSAAGLVASDLEFAQSMSVATPGDNAMIRYDPANPAGATYWVSLSSAPETPLLKMSVNTPYLVTLGQGTASQLTGVTFALVGAPDRIVFDEMGRLSPTVEVRVRLSNASGSIEVVVSPATGFITIDALVPLPPPLPPPPPPPPPLPLPLPLPKSKPLIL